MKKEYFSVTVFSLLFLILSAVLYMHVPSTNSHRDVDSAGYEKRALLFAKTGSFVDQEEKLQKKLVQQPRGYPLFISLIYRFSTKDFYLIWIQILLTLLTGLIFFFGARNLFGPTVASIAHALFCVNIGYLVYAQFILAESLLVFLLVLFFERLTSFIKTKQASYLGHAGFALGLSILVKPAALFYMIPFGLLLILQAACFQFFTKHKLAVFACIIGFLLPLQFYQGSVGNFNLYVWFWSKVETDQIRYKSSSDRDKVFIREKEKRISKNQDDLKREFWREVREKPVLFAKTWAKEMIKTCSGLYLTCLKVLLGASGGSISFFYGSGSLFNRVSSYVSSGTNSFILKIIGFLEIIFNLLRYLFAFIALCWLFVRRRWFLFLFFTSYMFYFTLVTGFDGCARYRTMFEFVLLLLAALGITLLFAPYQVKERGVS